MLPTAKSGLLAVFAMSLLTLVACGTAGAAPLKIMPLGDSITGTDPTGYAASDPLLLNLGRYRTPLWGLLSDRGVGAYDFVGTLHTGETALPDWDNDGHAGNQILDILAGASGWIGQLKLAGTTPDVVLLMIGTNDMRQSAGTAAKAPGRLSSLIDSLTTALPEAKIVISSIPLMTDFINDRVVAYNGQIPGIVQAKVDAGKHVEFVDAYANMVASDLLADKYHPTASGYLHIAEAFAPAIPTPEPATVMMLACGLVVLIVRKRRGR